MGSDFNHVGHGKPFKIAIVGGGLGGLCLALCLKHHKIPFHIYEAAPSFGEIGAGVMFGPHAANALSLISEDALQAFRQHMTINKDDTMKWAWLPFRFGTDSKDGSFKTGEIETQIYPEDDVRERCERFDTRTANSVHRARLLDELVKMIPTEAASFSKALVRQEQKADSVMLYFADGTNVEVDAVVGCDGIKSKVRSSLMAASGKTVEPQYVGEYAYRSLIDAEVVQGILGEKIAVNANLWQGYGGYIVNYPVEKGKLINVVAVVQDTSKSHEHSYERLITPVSREQMYEDWKDWDPRIQKLFREFKTSDQWALWDLLHSESYYKSRVCLLGDAAHAAVPHLGSGAGMAVEDAFILGNLLSAVTDKADLESAFAAYDAVRRPRTQKLVAKSRDAGLKHSLVLPGVGDDLEALRAYSKEQYKWVWGLDLEQHLRDARVIYDEARSELN